VYAPTGASAAALIASVAVLAPSPGANAIAGGVNVQAIVAVAGEIFEHERATVPE
jgi:hypothetical protein